MRVMRSAGSPTSSAPSALAMSPSRNSFTSSLALGVQGLDHLLGDVGARAGEHGFLQDEVVLLALEDLLDDLVRAFHHRGEFLVLALVEVFLEFAALALDLSVLIDQLALAAVALRLGERGCVLLELVGGRLQAQRQVVEFLVAL